MENKYKWKKIDKMPSNDNNKLNSKLAITTKKLLQKTKE